MTVPVMGMLYTLLSTNVALTPPAILQDAKTVEAGCDPAGVWVTKRSYKDGPKSEWDTLPGLGTDKEMNKLKIKVNKLKKKMKVR